MKVIWMLGADDPEMNRIEKVLRSHGQQVKYATIGGVRVNPENAYDADHVKDKHPFIPVWVECRSVGMRKGDIGLVVDHHRPHDPGFSLSYEKFWEASSLGQVFSLLRKRATRHDLVVAAVDHCPREAFAGKCPGVTGEEARIHRRKQLARSTKLTLAEISSLVKKYERAIAITSSIQIGGKYVLDLRSLELGKGYDPRYLCLQQALLEKSVTNAIFKHRSASKGNRIRVIVNATAQVVKAFKNVWAPKHGLTAIYGAPTRSYAGGYEK